MYVRNEIYLYKLNNLRLIAGNASQYEINSFINHVKICQPTLTRTQLY